ncbi:MAG: hypothetical protein WC823_03585 [Parcubacteria group bacterium]|jgi:hypothetical protein
MKKNIFIGLVSAILVGLLFVPQIILAGDGLVPCGTGDTACTLCDLIVGFSNLTTFLTKILVVITLAGMFVSGVLYILSAGDDGMMTTAKNAAKSSLIGFIIVLGAWLIVNVTLWVVSGDVAKVMPGSTWYEFTCIK